MNERVLAKKKTSTTPPQANQACSPQLHQRPLTDEISESVGSNSNISKELAGIKPKTTRRGLNWQNISVEAPSRGNGMSLPGGIQSQQKEPGGVIGEKVSADSAQKSALESSNSTISTSEPAQKPLIARAPFNGRNIPVEAPQRSSASSTYPEGIQRLETSGVKEQEKSTESLQMQPEEEIQAKSNEGEPQEKEEQNQESVQTKLTVGAPGDKHEQEADSMAAKVMTMPDSAIKPPIQRQTGEETEAVQMQPEEEIQAKSNEGEPQEKEEQNQESVQTKLTVGAPGDKYEQEADSMAAKVMTMPDSAIKPPIQRQTGEDTEAVQMQPEVNSITPLVQRSSGKEEEVQMKSGAKQASGGSSVATSSIESRLASSKGGGSALPADVRSFMEPRFGADFSNIKVHTDSNAVQMNKELGAQAFAHGSDIYFGAGKSPGKNELTAHELTHTIQQGAAGRMNKEVRRSPNQQFEEKEQLQAKNLPDRTLKDSLNKELRLQQQQHKEEEGEPLQAKEIPAQTPEVSLKKELRLQPLEEQKEGEPLQAKEIPAQTPEVSLKKELRLQPVEEQEKGEPLQAKEIPAQTPEVSSNKELQLQQQQQKEEEGEPLQAKEIPGQIPEVSSNKELRLQPLQEQEETEPLQAKELPGDNPEVSLNKELRRQPEETPDGMIQAKTLESGFTPSGLSIQRGIGDLVSNGWNKTKDFVGAGLGKGRDLLTGGLDWVKNNIIRPLTSLASSGWNAVKGFGSQIGNAFQQANPTIWDVFQPEHLMFRMASNQRKQLFAQAIQAERSQQAQAAAGIQSSGAAPVTEPSQLQRLNGLAETIESGAGKVFDIKKEILEGAVVGDFNENPTIWNTIGQVAIGFVPYAGQVADIRDIVANVKKLHETGYKDPDAWINLGLTAIGIIPGVGDAIKAAGKGSKGAIRKGLSSVLKNADNILRPVLGKAKGMLNGAGRYGKQFLGWASGQGAKLLQGVKGFGQKTVNFAKAAGQRARGLVTALNSRIGGFVNGAMQRARNVANQGRGLLGKVMGPFMGMATKAFDAVKSRVSQAVNMVKTAAQRGKDVALKVGSKIADTTRKAGNLLKDFTQSAIQKGRQALQTAKQWSSQQIKTATELGSRWVTQARKRVADLVSNGVKLAKEKAIPFIKQKLGGVKHRIKDFLQDKWNRLKEKLGIKKPGKEGPKGGAKETPDTAAKKAAELPAAIAMARGITAANDKVDTPVPALLGVLHRSVKRKYSWIKRFEARPKRVPGHYSVYMIASENYVGDYTTLPDPTQVDQRIDNLRQSGMLVGRDVDDVQKKLNSLVTEAKQGQVGAQGEIAFLERQVFGEGRKVEVIPDAEQGIKQPDFSVHHNQAGQIKPEVTEVKTTKTPPNNWKKWIKDKIKDANKQLKKSQLTEGVPGSVEMQLYGDAKKNFSEALLSDAKTAEEWITLEFRPDQMSSLRRVAIYGDGQLILEFVRTANNTIEKTFP